MPDKICLISKTSLRLKVLDSNKSNIFNHVRMKTAQVFDMLVDKEILN